ncbi:putative prephenate dehydrogenase [NADP(+)] [Grifola frondosa]|uniref:Putative prephenate dehydrogenase [NADP(+)] n=1 Tax=Grifola frondosa TaxID=5627 RepID=A0A1C7LNB5_GRIFR|nr:putative prephenate dehydrogenase [NADP(+)] [Grifola frondosa]
MFTNRYSGYKSLWSDSHPVKRFYPWLAAFALCSIFFNICSVIYWATHRTRAISLDHYQRLHTKELVNSALMDSSHRPNQNEDAIVTSLYTDDFAFAAAILGHSLNRVNTTARRILMYIPDQVSPHALCIATATGFTPHPVTRIPPPEGGRGIYSHFADQFTKLKLWELDRFGVKGAVYLDADTLVLRNFDELFGLPYDFAAVPDVYDNGFAVSFNAGVLLMRPSSALYRQMVANIETAWYWRHEAEQAFLNAFYGAQALRLPYAYNVNLAMKQRSLGLWEALEGTHSSTSSRMGVRPDVTPKSPPEEHPAIGLIGMGAMGTMYAKYLADAGWEKIYVCDQASKYEALKEKYHNSSGITVLRDGHLVSRVSDFIMYSVEAEYIDRVVEEYGPSTKVGAIVAGQTSVKAPEKAAFEKYLPEDVHIVSCHSLHGPSVSPLGQPLVLIKHRATNEALTLVENILRPLQSRYVYLSYEDHDVVTANTQAVTHAAFLTMGTAWASALSYPWEHGYYVGGIETVKVNIMLRIYSNKWHVYAGLAIMNPSARIQIDQFSRSTTEIFKLMLAGDAAGLRQRIYEARDIVFGAPGQNNGAQNRAPILLSEDILDRELAPLSPGHGRLLGTPRVKPFVHLDLAATPIFRMWIGVAEYLFRSQERLDAAIHAALYETSHRSDDLEFVIGARGWSQCISFGSFELYKERFMHTAAFFESRFEDATKVGSAMIQAIMDSSTDSDTKFPKS